MVGKEVLQLQCSSSPSDMDEQVPDSGVATRRLRILWCAEISIQHRKETILFRSSSDITQAVIEAQRIVDTSASTKMVGANLDGVKKVGYLWN